MTAHYFARPFDDDRFAYKRLRIPHYPRVVMFLLFVRFRALTFASSDCT